MFSTTEAGRSAIVLAPAAPRRSVRFGKYPQLIQAPAGSFARHMTATQPTLVQPRKSAPYPSELLTITFQVSRENAPALKSAIEEITNEVGGRLEAPHAFAREDALTRAAIALGALRRAVSAQVPAGDRDYK
jgi:hypothetical protein